MAGLLLLGLWAIPYIMGPDTPPQSLLPLFHNPDLVNLCLPKNIDKTRFLFAITALPAAFGLATLAVRRWKPPGRIFSASWIVAACAAQLSLAAFLVWMDWYQSPRILVPGQSVPGSCMILAALAIAVWVYARNKAAFDARLVWIERGPGLWMVYGLVALLAAWQVRNCFFTVETMYARESGIWYNAGFTLDEYAAILNGRTPLVDYFPQYHRVIPYLFTWYFYLFGLSATTFSVLMILQLDVGMILVFDTLRRITGTTRAALILGLPIIAISSGLSFSGGYFAIAPIRYLCVWIVGWGLVLHLRRPSFLGQTVFLFVASIMAINNSDSGLIALAATIVTLFFAGGRSSLPGWRETGRLAMSFLIGLGFAVVVFGGLTWIRSGRLPDLAQLMLYPRLYGVTGYINLPTPVAGTHWLFFCTHIMAICAGLVRRFQAPAQTPQTGSETRENRVAPERILTSALIFFGVFGAASMIYFMGRSIDGTLRAQTFQWAMSTGLLGWQYWADPDGGVQTPSDSPPRFPNDDTSSLLRWIRFAPLIPFALFFGLAWTHIGGTPADPVSPAALEDAARFRAYLQSMHSSIISAHARPGDPVCILTENGHFYAQQLGVDDVFPFNQGDIVVFKVQVQRVYEVIKDRDVRLIYGVVFPSLYEPLRKMGFRIDPRRSHGNFLTLYRPDPDSASKPGPH